MSYTDDAWTGELRKHVDVAPAASVRIDIILQTSEEVRTFQIKIMENDNIL